MLQLAHFKGNICPCLGLLLETAVRIQRLQKNHQSCIVLVFILRNSHEPICQLTLNCWTCLEVKDFAKQNNYLTCKSTLRLQQEETKN